MAGKGASLRYLEVAEILRARIRSGELRSGDRLPSYAEMYRIHGATTATMQRVCDVLEEEGLIERRHSSGIYVAPRWRRATGNVGFIGSAAQLSRSTPFNMALMEGIQEAVEGRGRQLLYLGTGENWSVELHLKVDGMLLYNPRNGHEIVQSIPHDLPAVSLFSVVEDLPAVGVDDYRAARDAVNYLQRHGHCTIAGLFEKVGSQPRRRFQGYRDAVSRLEQGWNEQWCRLGAEVTHGQPKPLPWDMYRQWGRQNMEEWLQNDWGRLGCTAIVVQNDLAAMGVMDALQEAGINVPGKVSVMGFDGTELCDLSRPQLTSVHFPLRQIAQRAVQELCSRMDGESDAAQFVGLDVTIREGRSVTSIPR